LSVVATISIISCAQSATAPRPSNPAFSPAGLILTAQSPTARVVITVSSAAVKLSITRIANPSGQAVGIHVVVDACTGSQMLSYDLGLVSPYPVDRTGVFVLSLPDGATTHLKSCAGAASMSLTLVPVRESEILDERIQIIATVTSS